MSTSRSYLKGSLHTLLPFHISEIEVIGVLLLVELLAGVNKSGLVAIVAIEEADNIRQIVHAIDIEVVDNSGLTHIFLGDNESFKVFLPGTDGNGKGTADGLDLSVEAKFAHHHIIVQPCIADLSMGSEDADCQRKVITAALLADVSRTEVDGQIGCRWFKARIGQSRANTVVAFLHGSIGES